MKNASGYLIKYLLAERNLDISVPHGEKERYDLFRALCNVRPPMPVTAEFIKVQNGYLTARVAEKGITDVNGLVYENNISLFKGDITTLNADAIVNAGNSQMLGCFHPLHGCIDNAIHSASGIELRLECNKIMNGREAENGEVIVTKGYNLPCKYVFHTVGPIVYGEVTEKNEKDLEKCYSACLDKADELNLKTIAFCCISTGEFGYPKEKACAVAVKTVKDRLAKMKSNIKVVFDVFTGEDYDVYKRLLG